MPVKFFVIAADVDRLYRHSKCNEVEIYQEWRHEEFLKHQGLDKTRFLQPEFAN